ncbi:MAG: RHS repeat protein [Spirochaetaceae bacterium]|nr:RHS repeat protein [Spirochaetaceae bacterium]
MITFSKKHTLFIVLFICSALFLSAAEKSFNIPGKGTIKRDVSLQTVENYDKNGCLTSSESAMGPVETYTYDKKGKLILFANENGFEQNYEYDKKGNLIHMKDNEGFEVWYTYDDSGKLSVAKDNENLETHYTYDAAGNLYQTELWDLEGDAVIEMEWYYYDDNNRLIRKEVSYGSAVDYTYDKAGNLIGERYSDGTNIEYVYSQSGQLLYRYTTTSDSEQEEFYEYELWNNGKVKTRKTYLWEVFG